MTVKDILDFVDKKAPFAEQCEWDNSGLLIGHPKKEVKTIYLALDATEEVIDHAISIKADLLLTHHPLIFDPLRRVTEDEFVGRRILHLAENGIALISAHTNFDKYGMREAIDSKLNLLDVDALDEEGIGSIGKLSEPMTLSEYAEVVRDAFHLSTVKVFGDGNQNVQRIAVCGGSGKCDIPVSISRGADVLVTGDIDHHSGIDAVAQKLAIIDAGHYGLEHVFMEYMKNQLESEFEGLCVVAEPFSEPFWVI